MEHRNLHHWRTHTDSDRILWLILDRKDESVNTINQAVLSELQKILSDIESQMCNQKPIAVVIASGKKNGFIAGADITAFSTFSNEDDAFLLIRQAHIIFDQLAALSMPTIAMISGFCLGGGCELALACTYRIAEDIPSTRVGLPEVKLGIHPGWGGTVRLPALIGAPAAMRMMLSGEILTAAKAVKIGVIDAAVYTPAYLAAVRHYALHRPRPHRPTGFARFSNQAWLRFLLAKKIRRDLAKAVRCDHYPAPFEIIDHWMQYGISSAAYVVEAHSIARLLMTDTSRHLVRVFFLQNRLKNRVKSVPLERGLESDKILRVHVIGAGTMGGDIAAWCAYKGCYVTLQDQSAERIAPAMQRAAALYAKKLRQPRLIQAVMDRLQSDVGGAGVRQADIVIEAIFEDVRAKQQLYQLIEPQLQSHAILATNTSSISLDQLATVLNKPERLIGIHFFNPVAKMQLVEVVCGKQTALTVIEQAMRLVCKIDRLPVLVKSEPGFLVNRLLLPYLLEAMMIYEEGVAPQVIDQIAMDFGMPMGPIALADKVGLDICLSVAEVLTQHYGGSVPEALRVLVQSGHRGCKTGKGFYEYRGKKRASRKSTGHRPGFNKNDIQDRMIFRLLNEAFRCLEEQIVEDGDVLDAAMIFGTGFAPFHGGPIAYAKERGLDAVLKRFEELRQYYGDRFRPTSRLLGAGLQD